MIENSYVSGAEFIEELKSQPCLFTFIPFEGSFDIKLDGGSSFESILSHLDFSMRWSITSNAGLAVEGFSR